MGQIRRRIKFTKPNSDWERSLEQEFLSAWLELSSIINGGLKFTDNFNCKESAVSDTGTANTEFAVAHTLKRIPIGYLVIRNNKAGFVYDSSSAFTAENIYLKHSIANAAITILIF